MHEAEWHLVRRGQLQLFGSKRRITGDPFIFLPLFRTHREAECYCRQSGLWHQGIRPMHSRLSEDRGATDGNQLASLFSRAAVDGVHVVGVYVGESSDRESCWEYFRAALGNPDGTACAAHFEALPEDERPMP
jgi:hypothetical protein